jgi:hypothetical protein
MALGIYSSASVSSKLSSDGTFQSSLSVTFDGRSGGNKQVKLYVRNSNDLYYYESILVGVTDSGVETIIDQPSEGFSWKLIEGDTQPTENDWKNTGAAVSISLSDIGASGNPDTSTFLPFWVYIEVPPGLDVQTFDTVKLTISANEVLV